jgi:hypothetical protein
MLKFLEGAGERLLARLLPAATASADVCYPSTYCQYSANYWRRVWVRPNCTVEYSKWGPTCPPA